jgi:hypothetical protein
MDLLKSTRHLREGPMSKNAEFEMLIELVLYSPYFWKKQPQKVRLQKALLKCESYSDLKPQAKGIFDKAFHQMSFGLMMEECANERLTRL